MKKIFLLFILISSTIFSCNGTKEKRNLAHLTDTTFLKSSPQPAQFGDYDLYGRMDHFNVPGLSIAVVGEGKIIWAEGYGKADIESDRNVDVNTLFQAASVSKPIAALAILKLSEENRVDLDENVNKYLKSYKIPENEFAKEKKVTLRAILAHTAGLNVEGFGGYNSSEKIPTTNDVIRGKGNSEKVVVEAVPESRWYYSGGGYTVMQKVVEDVSNTSFEEFMKTEILDPLGMTSSTFAQPLPQEYYSNVSSAFDSNGKLLAGKWHNYPEKAAAGLWTTPTDLAKYCIRIQEIYSRKTTNGIISKETVDMMLANHFSFEYFSPTVNIPTDYERYWGLGLEIAKNEQVVRFQHGGFNHGFKANFTAFANEGKAIVIMANADNGFDLIMEIEKAVSDYYEMGIWQ